MKYKDFGFRGIYKQFVAYTLNDTVARASEFFPNNEDANCILGYGYIDKQVGLTVEIIACGVRNDNEFSFFDTSMNGSSKLRIGAVQDYECWIIDDDEQLYERFREKIDRLKCYEASEEVEEIRKMGFLDECRNDKFPDDLMVYIIKDGLQPEGCWVRMIGIGENCLKGTLLNEPIQDFGYHEQDTVEVFIQKQDDGSLICYSDMN